jgi:hypothetical protein
MSLGFRFRLVASISQVERQMTGVDEQRERRSAVLLVDGRSGVVDDERLAAGSAILSS